ncbi:hypothetical protein AB0O28_19125 [Microbispora sp. NPDC088329]|uniref:hypothetical protein n=1 Tax=Microbispora sp. NPDC088329 TaxID=3154869 RepID=UPI00341F55E5
MYGSRVWLWLSTKRQLVNETDRLEKALCKTDAELARTRIALKREREAALARRLPADLAADADAAVAGREGGPVVDDLRTAAAAVRAGLPGIPADVTAPWADWLDDHAAEHLARECMWAPDICPAARTARALRREVKPSDGDRASGGSGSVSAG